jgi:hypothetical protein
MQMVMSQLMNNPHFNNMHIEMRDSPGFRYRYRNASPRAQQPAAMQGPHGRHSCAPTTSYPSKEFRISPRRSFLLPPMHVGILAAHQHCTAMLDSPTRLPAVLVERPDVQ